MTTPDIERPGPSEELDAAGAKEVLDSLQGTVSRLLENVRRDRTTDAAPAVKCVDALLVQLKGMIHPTAEQVEQLDRIVALHRQVQLAVAQGKDEVGRRLAGARRGHNGLKAYRNAVTPSR